MKASQLLLIRFAALTGIFLSLLLPARAADIHGMVGVGTWGTQAEFKDIKVTRGNETLYSSDFSKGLDGWKTSGGKWEVVDGALRQSGKEEGAKALVGDPKWENYTLTLKARKLSGDEGFLILFGMPDEETKSWWNVGGWENTEHGFQAPFVVGDNVPGKVESHRWYDIKVELDGDTIRAYLDGKLVQTAQYVPRTHTVKFSTEDPGVDKSVTTWGMGTIGDFAVMESGRVYMGADQIDVVIMPFGVFDPLTEDGDISEASKKMIDDGIAIANLAGKDVPLIISVGVGGNPNEVNPFYIKSVDPKRVRTDRWAKNMIATRKYVGDRKVLFAQPFNEPDWWQEGSPEDLHEIIRLLQADPAYADTKLGGAAVLYVDGANYWYDHIKDLGAIGTTHALAGSMKGYIDFLKNARGNSFCPELHSLAEAIIGTEYGMGGGIYWLRVDLARGEFTKACQGKGLAYEEDLPRWTAAAVYRAPGGKVQAFLGGSERMGQPTDFRFVSTDRPVFFDGDGPRREFTATIGGAADRVVNITWGEDVQPKIEGRYVLVNRKSCKVLTVAGADKEDGAAIQQMDYSRKANQQWDIVRLPEHGDLSYFTVKAAHSGKALDTADWNFDEGGKIQQWGDGGAGAQQWFFEYAGDNDFYIRSGHSGKCLGIENASSQNGAAVQQFTLKDDPNLLWRLIPVDEVEKGTIDFEAPQSPTGLTASAKPDGIELRWKTNGEPDLWSYTVFRSTTEGGSYDTIARGVTGNSFTDKEAKEGQKYFYVIKAVDRSLNQSSFSPEAGATPGAD